MANVDRTRNKIFNFGQNLNRGSGFNFPEAFRQKTMNKYSPHAGLLLLLVMFLAASRAEETAVVTDHKINVRGQPSLYSEVVTQLQKGDTVTILERTNLTKPKPG